MTATATRMVKAVWQAYFRPAGAKEGEEEPTAKVRGWGAGGAQQVFHRLRRQICAAAAATAVPRACACQRSIPARIHLQAWPH